MCKNEDFEGIYKKYRRFSVGIAYKIVHDEETAKDISQDVFSQLYQMGDTLDIHNEEKVRALIAISSANRAKDYMKSAYSRKVDSTDLQDELREFRSHQDLEAAILRMEANEYRKMVLMRYRNVNRTNYEILVKVKYLEIPPDDVAKEYGITRNGVNNRILRARLWLETELHKIYQ